MAAGEKSDRLLHPHRPRSGRRVSPQRQSASPPHPPPGNRPSPQRSDPLLHPLLRHLPRGETSLHPPSPYTPHPQTPPAPPQPTPSSSPPAHLTTPTAIPRQRNPRPAPLHRPALPPSAASQTHGHSLHPRSPHLHPTATSQNSAPSPLHRPPTPPQMPESTAHRWPPARISHHPLHRRPTAQKNSPVPNSSLRRRYPTTPRHPTTHSDSRCPYRSPHPVLPAHPAPPTPAASKIPDRSPHPHAPHLCLQAPSQTQSDPPPHPA